MEVNQLRHFLTVARLGSMTDASEALNMSQPGLSKSIGALEHRLGTDLLRRLPNGVELNEAGHELVPHAEAIIVQLQNAMEAMHEVRHGFSGTVRIGTGVTWASAKLPALVANFVEKYTNSNVKIISGYRPNLVKSMLRGELDIVFASTPTDELSMRHLRVHSFAFHERFVVGRKGHPLAEIPDVDMASLLEFNWVLQCREGLWTDLARQFTAKGLSPPDPVVEAESWTFRREFVKNSDALTLATIELLSDDTHNDLAKIQCRDVCFSRDTAMIVVRDRELAPAAQKFYNHAKQTL